MFDSATAWAIAVEVIFALAELLILELGQDVGVISARLVPPDNLPGLLSLIIDHVDLDVFEYARWIQDGTLNFIKGLRSVFFCVVCGCTDLLHCSEKPFI